MSSLGENLPPYLKDFYPFWENNDLYTEETKKKLRKLLK